MGLPPVTLAGSSSGMTTVTRYCPGRAPSLVLNVVSRKLPSDSVRPPAARPSFSLKGRKVTVAPAKGLPSRVTAPWIFTALASPQPTLAKGNKSKARRTERRAPTANRSHSAPRAPRFALCAPAASGQLDGLPVIADAQLDVGRMVDSLGDEPHRAIAKGEIGAAGMVRFEAIADLPIPNVVEAVRLAVVVRIAVVRLDRVIDRHQHAHMRLTDVERGPAADQVSGIGIAVAAAEQVRFAFFDQRLAAHDGDQVECRCLLIQALLLHVGQGVKQPAAFVRLPSPPAIPIATTSGYPIWIEVSSGREASVAVVISMDGERQLLHVVRALHAISRLAYL